MHTETGSPTVFGADEQRDIEVDVARWVRLARLVLNDERVHERYGSDVEMSLMFVDTQTIAELNERFLGVDGPTDVLSFPLDEELPPGGRQPDQGGRGPGAPGSSSAFAAISVRSPFSSTTTFSSHQPQLSSTGSAWRRACTH